MVDIGTMAIHRGLATKKGVKTTLQALVAKLGYHFPNPYEIRRSDILYLATPELSKDAQVYCAKYVEAPLLAYAEYHKLPNIVL